MKVNLPITQRERPFPKGCYVVSKTDLKGVTTYANDAFIELSGFARDELIGKSHNIVRHPDMPPQAFEDLWRTIKADLPWQGTVKNRCKNGDHYWVHAFVVPVRENDQTVGYMSVRTEPSRAAITFAEGLYQQLNKTKAALDTSPSRLKRISIKTRLLAVMTLMGLLLIGGAVVGIGGLALTDEALDRTYHARLEPVDMIGRITTLMSDNRGQIMLGLQHNPANPFSKLHDHAAALHTDTVVKNRDEITALTQELAKRETDGLLKPLLDRYSEARAAFVNEGLSPARQMLVDGQYEQANELLLKTINPTYSKAAAAARELQDALKKAAREEYAAAQERYHLIRNLVAGGAALALLLVAAATLNLLRSIVHPLNRVIGHFDRISQGNLTEGIDISGRDEAGRVLTQLAAMQVHLKVMLDEIQAAAKGIEAQSARVESRTA